MTDDDQVRALVESWRHAFETNDREGLLALFDPAHPRLTYQATEGRRRYTSLTDISRYYEGLLGSLQVRSWRTWDVAVDLMSPEFAFASATTDMLFDLREASSEYPAEDHYWLGRVSFVAAKRGDEWKIVHYEDSTPLQYMVPIVSEVQQPLIEECAALVQAGEKDQALSALERLARPVPIFALSHANRTRRRDEPPN